MENGEQDYNNDNDLLDDFDTGLYTDEISEVEEATEEMLLSSSFISYCGEPLMDAQSFNLWCKQLPKAQVQVEELTFSWPSLGIDRLAPFESPFA